MQKKKRGARLEDEVPTRVTRDPVKGKGEGSQPVNVKGSVLPRRRGRMLMSGVSEKSGRGGGSRRCC